MSQVVIVGAGVAGATLALMLVQRGITVKLFEAARNFQRIFRGEGLMPSGLDALAQMGLLSILERIPHRALDAWEFYNNKRSLFRVDEPIAGGTCTLVSQPAFLEAVINAASNYPNFEFFPGTAVQDLLWDNQRVVGVKLSDKRNLDADIVIGTDGRNSIVRQRADLQLAQKSHSFDILWFKLADSPRFASENVFYSIVDDHHAFGVFCSSEGNLQVGWTLSKTFTQDWKVDNWGEIFANASPAPLAEHFRAFATTIEKPVLLSVVVGLCPRWYKSGLLLLGDAAHPMSPIRAQGINMALRDVIVATNHLVPVLSSGITDIDAVLPQIQLLREPEIIRVQKLQAQEAAQAELLGKSALLRWGVSQFAPVIRYPIRLSWLKRQRQLRQGTTQIELSV